MPSGADLGGPVIVPVMLVTVLLSNNGAKTAALFAWLLLFRKWTTTGLICTYIRRVLVIDGYLYS